MLGKEILVVVLINIKLKKLKLSIVNLIIVWGIIFNLIGYF